MIIDSDTNLNILLTFWIVQIQKQIVLSWLNFLYRGNFSFYGRKVPFDYLKAKV